MLSADEGLISRLRRTMQETRREREAAAEEIQAAEAEVLANAKAALTLQLPEHLIACGVPRRIVQVIQDGLRDTPALGAVERFAASPKCFLVLAGQVGCGKSVAAATALGNARRTIVLPAHPLALEPVRYQRLDSRKGLFVTAPELAYTSPYSDEGRELLGAAAAVPWLVLDELGSEQKDSSGHWMQKLEHVLGTRYAECRKTVITTNLTSQALGERYEARIRDRLRDAAEFISCGEHSMRGGR